MCVYLGLSSLVFPLLPVSFITADKCLFNVFVHWLLLTYSNKHVHVQGIWTLSEYMWPKTFWWFSRSSVISWCCLFHIQTIFKALADIYGDGMVMWLASTFLHCLSKYWNDNVSPYAGYRTLKRGLRYLPLSGKRSLRVGFIKRKLPGCVERRSHKYLLEWKLIKNKPVLSGKKYHETQIKIVNSRPRIWIRGNSPGCG